MLALYELYSFARTKVTGSTAVAFDHARDIVAAERSLGIYWERSVQDAFESTDWFMALGNVFYGTVHFVMPVVTLVWLYRRAPARYLRWRNTLLCMFAIAIVSFRLYPLMPPRLMPKEYGFVDASSEYFNFGPQTRHEFGPDGHVTPATLDQYANPFAAMPSFHVGWSTWVLLALWPMVRRRWGRAALVAFCVAVGFCITVTANHWLLDVPGGWLVVGLGWLGAIGIERAGRQWRARRASVARPVPSVRSDSPGSTTGQPSRTRTRRRRRAISP